jgi:hypothetical protein
LAFTYDVDFIALRKALATTALASTDNLDDVASLLPRDEQDSTLHLVLMVARAGKKVEQQHSSIPTNDLTYIYENVVALAREIPGVGPNQVLTKPLYYPDHRHDPSKRCMTEFRNDTFVLRRPTTWLRWWSQKPLIQNLISDDVLIGLIAPNEDTRLLIASAIGRANDRYLWSWTDISTMPRQGWASETGALLSKEVLRKANELRGAGFANANSPFPTTRG